MKKYWQILKGYKASLLACPLLVLVSVMCETIQPMYMADIIDNGVMQRDLSVITAVGGKMVLISIVGLIFSIANVYVSSQASIGFGTDLRTKLFGKIQQLSFFDIDRFSTASLITRLTSDISRIQQVIQVSMRLMLRSPLMLVMAVFFVVRINLELAGVLLAAIPVLGFSVFFILRKGFPFFLKVQQKVDQLNEVVRENLINIRVVKSFVREDFEAHKFKDKSESLRDTVIHASNIIVAIFPVMQLVMNLSIIAILWMGGQKVMAGELKVGELISFVNYLAQVLMSLMMLSMIIMTYARASASSKRILEVLDTQPSLTDTPEGMRSTRQIEKGEIRFEKVSFRYGGGETDVLRNISFHVRPGETVAVAGATGSAKSSLVQLIPRLYDAETGTVKVGGVDVRDYNLDVLRREVSMVLQKNVLFSGTILDNLRWGDANATEEECIRMAKLACADEFIQRFPDKYNTWIEQGGSNVSGGQKQRLTIARALLRKPKVLILDDSTSAVDTATDAKIRKAFREEIPGTTKIIIAQRISSVQDADRILVLDNGQINGLGTHEELLKNNAIYQEVYNSQTQGGGDFDKQGGEQ